MGLPLLAHHMLINIPLFLQELPISLNSTFRGSENFDPNKNEFEFSLFWNNLYFSLLNDEKTFYMVHFNTNFLHLSS